MAARTTPSERRGMIALLAVMAIVVGIMALRSVGIHGYEPAPQPTQCKQPLESVAPDADYDTATRHPKHRKPEKQRGKRTRGKKEKTASQPTPTRSPLDENNN